MEVITDAYTGFLFMNCQPTSISTSSCSHSYSYLNKSVSALPIHRRCRNHLSRNHGVSNLMQTLPSQASASPLRHLTRGCYHHWNFERRRERAAFTAWATQSETKLAPHVEDLRKQLGALQEEAHQAVKRANNARARFIRLSDVVEELRLRAALDVKSDNEDNARLLLREKRIVMQALELSRKRSEIFEDLSSKLRKAISRKESELIAALSCSRLDLDAEKNDFNGKVRVVSPKYINSPFPVSFQQASGLSTGNGVDGNNEGRFGSEATEESSDLHQKGSDPSIEADSTARYPQESLLEEESMYNGRKSLARDISFKAFLLDIDDGIAASEQKLQQFIDVASILTESGWSKVMIDRIHIVRILLQQMKDLRTRILEAVDSSPSSTTELL